MEEFPLALPARAAVPKEPFTLKLAQPFLQKSLSEQTRRAYGRALTDFFHFLGGKHPTEVAPMDVARWRDHLRA